MDRFVLFFNNIIISYFSEYDYTFLRAGIIDLTKYAGLEFPGKKIYMKHSHDMTVGSPLKALIVFSLPIILGNLFQQFYNLMDIAIVGNRLGDTSLAAVGATSALYGLFLSLSHGFANGFS